jgi:glucosamine--fructose-6-phosphate aminotransferase (isomerizing)
MPCQVEIASEFRYRQPSMFHNTLMVFISQSGETADTLSAMREAKARGFRTLAVVNVPESSMVREADMVLLTRAGREMSVASTKGFTTQLVAMMLLVLAIGKAKGNLSAEKSQELVNELRALPDVIRHILTKEKEDEIRQMAEKLALKDNAMFLGRGFMYPIAEEGALKMKELSYIHAEAYPAGELKHGPLALIDEKMPVVSVAPNDVLWAKLKSNLEEVSARGGELFVFSAAGMIDPSEFEHARYHNICLPITLTSLAPVAYVVPLQLLAYHTAVIRGTDVDQPRNLAKSVTVE